MTPPSADTRPASQPPAKRTPSLIAADLKLEGSITGGADVQIDGSITGDVRAERVTIGDGGLVEGGVFAEAVEVKGRVSGSITAKQVRLFGAAHVEGDISHEQLSIENGAFFQGRSLRLQRPAPQAQITPPRQPAAARADGVDHSEARAAAPAA
ncbi:MAG TPA: polymer-forming cytoskeletal protein [Caulobacteraceae bacterium]